MTKPRCEWCAIEITTKRADGYCCDGCKVQAREVALMLLFEKYAIIPGKYHGHDEWDYACEMFTGKGEIQRNIEYYAEHRVEIRASAKERAKAKRISTLTKSSCRA